MENKIVFVITNTEMGWDCVVGVYSTKEKAIIDCAIWDKTTPEQWDEENSTNIITKKIVQ